MSAVSAFGQSKKLAIDSLRERLETEQNPQRRVDLYNNLAFNYFDRDDSLASYYAQQGLRLSEAITYEAGKKYSELLVGIGLFGKGQFLQAIEQFHSAIAVEAEEKADLNVYAWSLIGECYTLKAAYDSATFAFHRGIAEGKKYGSFWLPRNYCGLARIDILKWKNDRALLYLDSANTLLSDKKPDFRSLELMTLYGRAYTNLLQEDKALESYQLMCRIAVERADLYHQIKCALNRADYYYERAEYPAALSHALSALELSKDYKYLPQQALLYLKIGEIYVALSEYETGLSYYLKALGITEKLGLPNETAELYAKIAWVYKDQKRLDLALEYCKKSLEIRYEIDDQKGIASVYNIRGLVYLLQKKYPESIAELNKALAIRREINHTYGIVASLFNEALVYGELNQFEKALALHEEVLEVGSRVRSDHGLTISYNTIAGILIKLNRLVEAELYLQKAAQLIKKTNSKSARRDNYLNYAWLSEAKNQLKEALRYRKLYEAVSDSIFSEISSLKIAEMQAVYDFEKKENEINLLRNQQQLQENQLQLQNARIENQRLQIYVAVVFLGIISVFALMLFRLNKTLKDAKKKLGEVNEQLLVANDAIVDINRNLERKVDERTRQLRLAYEEIDTFFYRSSHDFRRPLTTLMGLADLAGMTLKDQQALDLFKKVKSTAESLDRMLYKLQKMSELGFSEMQYLQSPFEERIDLLLEKFQPDIARKHIHVERSFRLSDNARQFPALLETVAENLIENAVDFSRSEGAIIGLSLWETKEAFFFEVQDNGLGIAKEYQAKIFDMYYRAHYESKGNGLGLYIVKKAVEKMSGKLHFTSEIGKGSKFTVELPASIVKSGDIKAIPAFVPE